MLESKTALYENGTCIRFAITEQALPYDPADLAKWETPGLDSDSQLFNRMMMDAGAMGRCKTSYASQRLCRKSAEGRILSGGQYFAEVLCGGFLVRQMQVQPEDIIFENYRLSGRQVRHWTKGGAVREPSLGWRGKGCLRVAEVFSDRFLNEFDRLIDMNRSHFRPPMLEAEGFLHTDLFVAPGPRQKACFLIETKLRRTNQGPRGRTDKLQTHQLALLGITDYLVRSLKADAFALVEPSRVVLSVVSLVPHQWVAHYLPKTEEIEIRVK